MRLSILGPIGSGKGTQAHFVSQDFGILNLSVGSLYRQHVAEKDELGKLAEGYLQKGKLVPDSVTVAMIQDRLREPDAKKGYILDGFPRTMGQLKGFEAFDSFDAVLHLEVDDQISVNRLSGRRMCVNGHVYHVDYHPPKVEGVCDIDHEPLFQRADDQPKAIKERLRLYYAETKPVVDHLMKDGVLKNIDGSQTIEDVRNAIHAYLVSII